MHDLQVVHGDLKGVCGDLEIGTGVSLVLIYLGEHFDMPRLPRLHR